MKAKITKITERGDRLLAHTEIDYGEGKRSVVVITLNENSNEVSFQQSLSFFADLRRKGKPGAKTKKLDDIKVQFEAKIGEIIDIN